MNEWVVFFGVTVLIGLAAQAAHFQAQKRLAAFVEAANRLGWLLEPLGSDILDGRFAGFDLFRHDGVVRASLRLPLIGAVDRYFVPGGRVDYYLRGSWTGGEALLFDYSYSTSTGAGVGSRRSRGRTHTQTVAAFQLPRPLPAFEARPENFLHSLVEMIGLKDIDFESDPEFSKDWRLTGSDEAAVRSLFSSTVLQALRSRAGVTVEGGGPWLIVYRWSRRVDDGELAAFAEEAKTLAAAFLG